MIILLLVLIDIHTLFVLLFNNYMSTVYILAGSTLPILKGLIFYISSRDIFSLLDIVVGIIMLFILIGELWTFLFWFILIYLVYKIIMSFMAL